MCYTIFRVQRDDVLKGWGQEVNRSKCSACPHHTKVVKRVCLCCCQELAFFFSSSVSSLVCFGSGFGLVFVASVCLSSFHQNSRPLSVLL